MSFFGSSIKTEGVLHVSIPELLKHTQEIMGQSFIFNHEERCVQGMKGAPVKRGHKGLALLAILPTTYVNAFVFECRDHIQGTKRLL